MLFDDDGDDEPMLKVNSKFAEKYAERKKKEELSKLQSAHEVSARAREKRNVWCEHVFAM